MTTGTTRYYAYVKRSNDDWGSDLKATTERAAKAEARKLFANDFRDAVIYLTEISPAADGGVIKMPVASVPVRGGRWEAL